MAAKPSSARGGPMKRSDVSGFYKKSADERWQIIREFGELESSEIDTIRNTGALRFEQVDHMIENVVGAMPIPLGIAVNFQVNGKDYLVPMAIEEPSVVAAASNAARMGRERREHDGRGGCPAPGEMDRRSGVLANHLQPRRPPPGQGACGLCEGGPQDRRPVGRRGGRRHPRGVRLCGCGPVPLRDAQ